MSQPDSSADNPRLNEVIAAYLEAADAGQEPDREEVLRQHPDLAAELRAFFADRDVFSVLASPPKTQLQFAEAQTLPPTPQPAVATTGTKVRYFGDYELLEEVARGGMGVVYKARQVSLNRVVALKMILAGQLASPEDVKRFRHEAEAAANLKHPNIVALHEVGEHAGQHYFSMDYVAGTSLSAMVNENPLPATRAARYVEIVAQAIHYAHQQGTIHRDLKPSNILIDEADQPHVTDFGLAKQTKGNAGLTATGQILGTPSYMPPEQASGRRGQVTPASDVYSLGAVLYELVTGRPPFRTESAIDTILQVLETPPLPPRLLNPKVPADLDTVCLKCLEKDPAKRYQSAEDLADDLGRFLAGEPIRARPPSLPFAVRHWFRQNIRATAWTAGLGLISGVLISLTPMCEFWAYVNHSVDAAYEWLPNLNRPHTIPVYIGHAGWLMVTAAFLGFIGVCLQFLLPRVIRSTSQAGDLAAGAGSGLMASLVVFTLAIGPESSMLDNPSGGDLSRLGKAIDDPAIQEPSKWLAEPYPDLRQVQANVAGQVIAAKVSADHNSNLAPSFWKGMAISMLCIPLSMAFSFVGGLALRQRGGWRSILKGNEPANFAIRVTILFFVDLLFVAGFALVGIPLRQLESFFGASILILAWQGSTFLNKRPLASVKGPLGKQYRALSAMLSFLMYSSAVLFVISELAPKLLGMPIVHWLYWCLALATLIYAAALVFVSRNRICDEREGWQPRGSQVPAADAVSGYERRVLRPSRLKILGMTAVFAALTLSAAGMAAKGAWVIWLSAAVFGLITLLLVALSLLSNRTGLAFGPDGLTQYRLFRPATWRWAELGSFRVGSRGNVVFNFSPEYRGPKASGYVARVLTDGCDMFLPDLYGMRAEDLADLLNKYKAHYSAEREEQ